MIKNIICIGAVFFITSCAFNHENKIQILTSEKIVDITKQGFELCDSFRLTESEINLYFQTAEEVSNEEAHGESIIMPCKYSGELIMNKEVYSYEVFAGGAGYIFDDKGSVLKNFICKNNNCCSNFSNLC
ncbi:hypothetical protein [Pseudoalteromonas ruthenica]|uniref:hypothetical protein n=1 Tax=Pseudoalteromonas ruthenica TaxID=151081 RepID=UPI00241E0B92|nr:hypothetical protein [Pseudoalteromonas ruthenica]|tara:strand:- start:63801 stop:64190 length:390 start_codon:yes stop_codon:yes gene_type:complete